MVHTMNFNVCPKPIHFRQEAFPKNIIKRPKLDPT